MSNPHKEEKSCIRCEKMFMPFADWQNHCCRDCRKLDEAENPKEEKACIRCGEDFTPNADWQEHCTPECRKEHEAEKFKELAEEYYRDGLRGLAGNHPRHKKQICPIKWGIVAGHSKETIQLEISSHWGGPKSQTVKEFDGAYDKAVELVKEMENAPPPAPETEEQRARRIEQCRIEKERKHAEIERGKLAALDAVKKLAGSPMSFEQLQNESPVPLSQFCFEDHPGQAAALLLRTLYKPDDLVFCGELDAWPSKQKELIRGAHDWADAFLSGHPIPEQLAVNPMSGKEGTNQSGGPSYRSSNCVADYRYTLFESDYAPLDIQAAFLHRMIADGWPVASITYSGGKSLHALIRVDGIETEEQWDLKIKTELASYLKALGADDSCFLSHQTSRLPGAFRQDKGKRQSLLWLARPESDTEPLQAHSEPEDVQTSASVFEPFTDADRAYLESVL
jgi:hypothetical protein